MLKILSKEEEEANKKRLRKFVKDNRCEMYNYMLDVEGFRKEGENQERVRIINVIGKLELDRKITEKVYDAIMKKSQNELKDKLKKMGATVHNQDNH